jgi:hypothetical protein
MNSSSKKSSEIRRTYCLVNLSTRTILKHEDKFPLAVATLNSVLNRQHSDFTWISAESMPPDYSSRGGK